MFFTLYILSFSSVIPGIPGFRTPDDTVPHFPSDTVCSQCFTIHSFRSVILTPFLTSLPSQTAPRSDRSPLGHWRPHCVFCWESTSWYCSITLHVCTKSEFLTFSCDSLYHSVTTLSEVTSWVTTWVPSMILGSSLGSRPQILPFLTSSNRQLPVLWCPNVLGRFL